MRLLITFTLALAITLVALLRSQTQVNSQTVEQKRECGTEVTQEQIALEHLRASRLAQPSLAPQPGSPYHLPLTIHIVRQSNGAGGFTLNQLDIAMQDLNRMWQPVGVQFFIYGGIDFINDDNYFNVPDNEASRNALRQINPVANTINIYFTNLANLCGQSSFTSSSAQGVLIDNSCAGSATNPSTLAHEIGHYFDLFHTHETAFGVECPSESNCSSAGDKICDTPADPGLSGNVNSSCVFTGSTTPPQGCNNVLYNPPTKNLMSYSAKTCRDQFTNNQMSKILNVLTGDRGGLINSFTKYVASNASTSNRACTYQAPCNTINLGVAAAKLDDHIYITPGVYPLSPPTLSKRVFLKNRAPGNGQVQIVE